MVLFFLISGRALVFLKSSTGKYVVALCAWATVTLVTSVWKGGSIPDYYQLLNSGLVFMIVAGLPITLRNVRKMMGTLALAGLVAALMSIPFGTSHSGRFSLLAGSYYDPNYYAMSLVAIAPFFWTMAAGTQSYVIKIFAWCSLLPIFLVVARSGSRGAMLGVAVMLVLMFFLSSGRTKMLLVVATVGGVIIAFVSMPDYLRTRYFTFFEVDSKVAERMETPSQDGTLTDLDRLHSDSDSAQDRRRLLFTSIALTFEHPIFGVGPGNFPTAVFDEAKAAGIVHNEWLVTHNSYTQLSSETGFPGFFLFIGVIITSISCVVSVLKRSRETAERPDPIAYFTAKYMLFSMSALFVSIFFLAVGYEFTIYIWAGLAVSLRRTFDAQMVATEEIEEQPQRTVPEKPVLKPAYARVAQPLPHREPRTVEGRPVRFNRLR
jgi:hypothetical protein